MQFPQATWQALVWILENPKELNFEIENVNGSSSSCFICCVSISFTEEALQLCYKPHNNLLFVSGYIRDKRLVEFSWWRFNSKNHSQNNNKAIDLQYMSSQRIV